LNFESLMQQAISLAKAAADNGDVPVGALVVTEGGEVLGTGHNLRQVNNDPTAHAEIVAMRMAAAKLNNWRMDDLTMIVTLEPCAMCAGAISQSRFKRVVLGAWDEKAGAVGSVWDVIRDPRSLNKVEVITDVLEKDCALLLSDFFEGIREHRIEPE
jgi:tRNA(adenine34) deaminase